MARKKTSPKSKKTRSLPLPPGPPKHYEPQKAVERAVRNVEERHARYGRLDFNLPKTLLQDDYRRQASMVINLPPPLEDPYTIAHRKHWIRKTRKRTQQPNQVELARRTVVSPPTLVGTPSVAASEPANVSASVVEDTCATASRANQRHNGRSRGNGIASESQGSLSALPYPTIPFLQAAHPPNHSYPPSFLVDRPQRSHYRDKCGPNHPRRQVASPDIDTQELTPHDTQRAIDDTLRPLNAGGDASEAWRATSASVYNPGTSTVDLQAFGRRSLQAKQRALDDKLKRIKAVGEASARRDTGPSACVPGTNGVSNVSALQSNLATGSAQSGASHAPWKELQHFSTTAVHPTFGERQRQVRFIPAQVGLRYQQQHPRMASPNPPAGQDQHILDVRSVDAQNVPVPGPPHHNTRAAVRVEVDMGTRKRPTVAPYDKRRFLARNRTGSDASAPLADRAYIPGNNFADDYAPGAALKHFGTTEAYLTFSDSQGCGDFTPAHVFDARYLQQNLEVAPPAPGHMHRPQHKQHVDASDVPQPVPRLVQVLPRKDRGAVKMLAAPLQPILPDVHARVGTDAGLFAAVSPSRPRRDPASACNCPVSERQGELRKTLPGSATPTTYPVDSGRYRLGAVAANDPDTAWTAQTAESDEGVDSKLKTALGEAHQATAHPLPTRFSNLEPQWWDPLPIAPLQSGLANSAGRFTVYRDALQVHISTYSSLDGAVSPMS
ncbi:hypothetical protein TRAPUB_6997 [Trametes pubescens]|uniref:Uncharacterized protein n=1 Tax=Trametes pubescens TaxID=154538 RepID=A0A1M2V499_TRAPU|nr:hypothetical protein TRAPUB_6997 [Trametes pubescens]